jgi:hypothetical protein
MKMRARHVLALIALLGFEAWWIIRAVAVKVGL